MGRLKIAFWLFMTHVVISPQTLMVFENEGVVIREVTAALVDHDHGVNLPFTISLQKNVPDGIDLKAPCNGKTMVKVSYGIV